MSDSKQKTRQNAYWEIAVQRAQRAHRSPLFHDVVRLHDLFTAERDERVSGYLREPGLRRAYVGYFAPLNAVKIAALLKVLESEASLPAWRAPRVLDLGAGPLSGIAGAWFRYGQLGTSHAIDIASRAMEDGRSLLREAGANADAVSVQVGSLAAPWKPPFAKADLVILANVLNEVGDPRRDLEKRLDIVRRALSRVDTGGRLLIVEPGTRVHGRALSHLRDEILESEIGGVLAPCRGTMPCPLLRRKGDWCHHDLVYEPVESVRKLERQARLQKQFLKLSYLLVARKDDAQIVSKATASDSLRLIGGMMSASDGQRRYACGDSGMVVLESKGRRLPDKLYRKHRGELCELRYPGVSVSPVTANSGARKHSRAKTRHSRKGGTKD